MSGKQVVLFSRKCRCFPRQGIYPAFCHATYVLLFPEQGIMLMYDDQDTFEYTVVKAT